MLCIRTAAFATLAALVWAAPGQAFTAWSNFTINPVLLKPKSAVVRVQPNRCGPILLNAPSNRIFLGQADIDQALANRPPGATGPLVSLDQPGTLYCLSSDIVEPRNFATGGLTSIFGIDADDVTFDLNRRAIHGNLSVVQIGFTPTAAIVVGPVGDARIEGGDIEGFNYAIYGDAMANPQSGLGIEDLAISNPNGMGIVLYGYTNVTIRENAIVDVYKGIHVLFRQISWTPEIIAIEDNRIELAGEGYFASLERGFLEMTSTGIWAEMPQDIRVARNIVTLDPSVWGEGIHLSETRWRDADIVERADVEGNVVEDLGQGTGINVEKADGLWMADNRVSGFAIQPAQTGIRIHGSRDVIVEDNTLCQLDLGVRFSAKTPGRTTATRVTGNAFYDVLRPWSMQSGTTINTGFYTWESGGCEGVAQ